MHDLLTNVYWIGSRLEAPTVANGIEPTLEWSSTQNYTHDYIS